MTQDEIIRMAYAAGAVKGEHTVLNHKWFEFTQEQLERFAALVAEEKDHQIATLMCDIEEMYSREDVDHLIGVEREATKEKIAKTFDEFSDNEFNGEFVAFQIRSIV